MKYLNSYKIFENIGSEITVYDVAWLYFLCYVYDGKMKIESWKNDKRMKDTTCDISLSKFSGVSKQDGYYISDDSCPEIVDQWFGSKTFKGSLIKGTSLEKYDNYNSKNYSGYTISRIPNDLYMRKHPNLQKSFNNIEDDIVHHFNSHRCVTGILDKLSKRRGIKEFNFESFYGVFPDLPDTIKVYRGIKKEYDESRNEKGYSSWTYDKKSAERFAKHYFSGTIQFKPQYTENPYVLETEINFDDIVVMILSHGEKEIVLKNPVNIISSYRVD